MRASQNADASFADARAALRHTATPNEKPINPAYDGVPKRKGQPTINVGADMMAAFLTEMKTHRLRKVGSGSNLTSQPAIRAREVGADVGNRTEVVLRPREVQDVGNRSAFVPRTNAFATPAPPKITKASATSRNDSTGSESDNRLKRKHIEEPEPSSFGE